MQTDLETSLRRWVAAELIDPPLAERIRQFEALQAPERRARWPVIAAVAFGGIMLGAGVLLFVSAHWDELSPTSRMALLIAMVGGFHAAGAFTLDRLRALGITLHVVGTVALGAAIALAGQIFNMQEHWPAAVLMWTLGAVAGYALLRDWPHLALMALLIPWWLAGEWTEFITRSSDSWPVVAAGVLLLAISYFTSSEPALQWLGGLALLPAAIATAVPRHHYYISGRQPSDESLLLGWVVAMLAPLAVAWWYRRKAAWMNLAAAVWVIVLNVLAESRAEIAIYAWCALGAAALVAWGIHELRPERINEGMAGFALTIAFFFFSSVMDKLGRSASLITLGVLFVAGGWYWEQLRRRLVARVLSGGAQ